MTLNTQNHFAGADNFKGNILQSRILMLDVSGKVPFYDIALCKALGTNGGALQVVLALPRGDDSGEGGYTSLPLFRMPIPARWRKSGRIFKRGLKCLEVLANYARLALHLLRRRYDTIHFQWLPFLECCNIEKHTLRWYKFISPEMRFVLTIHNIFPHDCTNRDAYRLRFLQIIPFFDAFILHTEATRDEFIQCFGVIPSRVFVVPVGVFSPNANIPIPQLPPSDKFRILHFGALSHYKGTDLLVEALNHLPPEVQSLLETNIMGVIDKDYFEQLKTSAKELNINWFPYEVPDSMLYSYISASDLVVFPYRAIAQSGALLLAIHFQRMLLASELPSFVETLKGLPQECFFIPGDIAGLADRLTCHIQGKVPHEAAMKALQHIKSKYSWTNVERATIAVYQLAEKNRHDS